MAFADDNQKEERIPSLLTSPQISSSTWRAAASRVIKQFHLEPITRSGSESFPCCCALLFFIRCGLFVKRAYSRGAGRAEPERLWLAFLPAPLWISSCLITPALGLSILASPCTAFCSLHFTTHLTSFLVSLLWSPNFFQTLWKKNPSAFHV